MKKIPDLPKHRSVFFIIAGILLAMLFLPPFFKHIINIGNLTGMAVAVLVLFYGIFVSSIHHAVISFWQHWYGKILLSFAALICAVILLLTVVITCCLIKTAANNPPDDTDATAIVLGCSVHGNKPSLMLERRLEAALSYLEKHPDAKAVLSGGKGVGEDISEAQCMFTYLTEHGIDADRLYLEERSTDTQENIRYSKEILDGLDSSVLDNNHVVMITNEFHQYRASLLAKNVGINSYSISGKTVFYLLPTYYVRELYAVLEQWVLNILL